MSAGDRLRNGVTHVNSVDSARACSFCGKHEAEVARLLAGGGTQVRGELPVVFICDECVMLCHTVIASESPDARPLPEPEWRRLTYAGGDFEWRPIPTSHNGAAAELITIRKVGTTKTIGWVLPPRTTATPEHVEEAIRAMGHLL